MAHAQTTMIAEATLAELKTEYEYLIKKSFRSSENRLESVRKILHLAQTLANIHKIHTKISHLNIKTAETEPIPVLEILPEGTSLANGEARILAESWGNIKLYLNPYHLKTNHASATFRIDGSFISVPFDFIYNILSESYLHEKLHASTYRKVILGEQDFWAGSLRLEKGSMITPSYQEGYYRGSSLDEIVATVFSAVSAIEKLKYLQETYKGEIAFKHFKPAEDQLNIVYFDLKNLKGLCEMWEVAMSQAISKAQTRNFIITEKIISLGDFMSAERFQFEFTIASYERKHLHHEMIKDGSSLKF